MVAAVVVVDAVVAKDKKKIQLAQRLQRQIALQKILPPRIAVAAVAAEQKMAFKPEKLLMKMAYQQL
jgi:Na+-translocating ferredoxin:NAD+ oxidoreductase RnfG subunit